jgi:FtsP/CotA-like multicopper oxidase with cupredoxin domain
MNKSRRKFLLHGALVGAGTAALPAQHEHHQPTPEKKPGVPAQTAKENQSKPSGAASQPAAGGPMVEMPDLLRMPWTLKDGMKVFHITAEVVRREFLPGRVVDVWGFNGSMPGPLIEVNQGDRLRFIVKNELPEEFSMHWHGLEVPFEMDGVPGLTQDPIEPGGSFTYEFTVHQHGTFFYHTHMPMQQMMGMIGMFVIHPEEPYQPPVDRDFGLILQGWALLPNNTIPNSLSMEFNWLTLNGKAGPATTPMLVKQGERVRVRIVNLGMDHHPIHLHGNTFYVTGTEGGRVPEAAWTPQNTVVVGVAQARDFEFTAERLGDWMVHCHLPHHMMNQMVSMVGPMAHGASGVHAGMGMEEGMGMIREGHALAEKNGPSLGRALGVGSTFEERVTHLPVSLQGAAASQPPAANQHQHGRHGGHSEGKMVPGFPQDMKMVMDEMVSKPETYGLRPTWTQGMMGMMTLIRVLNTEKYDYIQRLKQDWKPEEKKPETHKHIQK